MLGILAIATGAIAVLFWNFEKFSSAVRRAIAGLSLISVSLLAIFGGISLGVFTLVAVVFLPTLFLLGRLAFQPLDSLSRARLYYCRGALLASTVSFFVEWWRLSGG
jgi:hypothetical protein